MTDRAKKLGNQPAGSEVHFSQNGEASEYCPFEVQTYSGLTKREYFATMAMSRMAHSNMDDDSYTAFEEIKRIAYLSTLYADALLEELSKTDKTDLNDASERYFLWDDGDGHQYCVPVRLRGETNKLDDLPPIGSHEDFENRWFAIFNEIKPQLIRVEDVLTFTNPKTE